MVLVWSGKEGGQWQIWGEEGRFRGAEVGTIAVEGVAGCGELGSGLGRQVRAFQEERRSGWAMTCLWTGS